MSGEIDYTIKSVEKALRLLNIFDGEQRSLKFSQIQRITGYSKNMVVRILYTLTKNGYLMYDDTSSSYSVGSSVYRLGHVAQISMNVLNVAAPYLKDLSNRYGLICYIGKQDYDHVLVLEKFYPSGLPGWAALMTAEGSDMPLFSTGIGKLILAEMSDEEIDQYMDRVKLTPYTEDTITSPEKLWDTIHTIRKTHIAYNNAENERFIHSICVPVYDIKGRMLVGISACGFSELLDDIGRDILEEQVKQIAIEVSSALGFVGEIFD